MQKQCVPFLLVILVLFSLSACSTRSSSANVQSINERLTALEEKVFNQQEKQQSINDWTAKRLGALEAQHPNLQVPPPPGFMQKETIRPDATNTLPAISDEVINTVPGQASIAPGKPNASVQSTGSPAPAYQPPAHAQAAATPPPAAAPAVQVQNPANAQPRPQSTSTATAPSTSPKMENGPMANEPAIAKEANAVASQGQASQGQISQGPAPMPAQIPAPPSAKPMAQNANSSASTKGAPPPQAQAQASAPKATAPAAAPSASSDKSNYAAALSLLERGKTEQGLAAMDKFLVQFPQSPLAPNAMYWRGEALYTQLKFDDAILAFKDVVTNYPKTNKAPDALLKIGMSYQRLSDMDNAKFYLQMLLEDYPDARSTALAKKQLAAIK